MFRRFFSKTMPGLLHDVDTEFKKATFGMGCFWSSDSLYGATKGVLRTRVGYSGGSKINPKYRDIGDHTEVIEIDYDPNEITYDNLLQMFWNNHEYGLTTKIKTQYMSLILYHDLDQKATAEKSMKEESEKRNTPLITVIKQAGIFYPAEDYHQKYRLQQHTFLMQSLGIKSEQLQTSHVAARLNGYLVGLGGVKQFDEEADRLGLSDKMKDYVRKELVRNEGGSLYC